MVNPLCDMMKSMLGRVSDYIEGKVTTVLATVVTSYYLFGASRICSNPTSLHHAAVKSNAADAVSRFF